MKVAAGLMFTLPGFPCIYYGDEAGVEGYKDPFNRSTFPWGKENTDLLNWHKSLAKFRRGSSCFNDGEFNDAFCKNSIMSYIRYDKECKVLCVFNAGYEDIAVPVPFEFSEGELILATHDDMKAENNSLTMPALSCAFIKINND